MKKLGIVLFLLFAMTAGGFMAVAQTISSATYTYARSGFAPADISTGNTQLIGPNSDNVASAVTDIGFTFWFAGTPYTQFSVSENGLMTLGSTQISGADVANSMGSIATLPKIAPYWDDLATGTNGSVYYKLTGTAPNRILIVNWYVTVPKNALGAANATIQVQLSEATGVISFTYGTPAVPANTGQYSIGIGASSTDFASVTPTSATAATCAYGAASNANTISPGVYTRYSFFPDAAAPTITYSALGSTSLVTNRTITATIADAKTGVPTSGSMVPRIYYKKNASGTYLSSAGTMTGGTSASGTWSFTIDHSLLGGVAPRDSVYYFIIAQDQSATMGTANRASNPAGVVASDVTTITTPPASPAAYKITGALISGAKTVGTAGADYTSLTNAGGLFEDLTDGKLTGDVTVDIITDLPAETGLRTLGAWANDAGGPFKVLIRPAGVRTVSGTSGLLKLGGTVGLTIDGLNDGTNALTLTCTSGSAVLFSKGASNNTITRTTLVGTGTGVIAFNDASGTFAVNCSGNTIDRCTINGTSGAMKATAGVYFGSWVASAGLNNAITNNVIKDFGQYGIHLDRGYLNFTIAHNDIFQTATGNYSTGIYIYNPVGSTTIANNTIHDLKSGTSLGVETSGIFYRFGGASDVLSIYNNVIDLDALTTNTQADKLYGLLMGGAGTSNIYNNSIYIGGTGVTKGNSAGLYRTGGTVTFRNNVVFNARSGNAVSQYYKHYGISALTTTNFTSNNNVIYANGTNGVTANVGANIGQSAGTDYATLAAWQAATSQDASSYSDDPGFTSPTNLMPDKANPHSHVLNGRGIPVPTITDDIAGNPRSTSAETGATDIGAYEFTPDPIFYTITGNAGVAGAVLTWMDGTAQTVTADGTGAYSISIPYGWSGEVTPSLASYSFTPATRTYSTVLAASSGQDYIAVQGTPVAISGSTGMPGVTIAWTDVTPKTTVSDANGDYTISVSYNWSGTLTASLAGYQFAPASRTLSNVVTDQTAQNFSASAVTYTVSGNAGAAGVMLAWSDSSIAKTAVTDIDGNYTFIVSYNWSGTVTPSFTGHTFSPATRSYTTVLSNQTGQNYTATAITYTISGSAGVAGAAIGWTDGSPKTAAADENGNYAITVSYNWSGSVTVSLAGYTFAPSTMPYTNVLMDKANQNYSATAITYAISGNVGTAGATVSWTDSTQKTATADSTGKYTITVSYGWSGTVTPSLAGNVFSPASRSYSNLFADQSAQDYSVGVYAKLRVMLQGPFSGGTMTTALNAAHLLPLTSDSAYAGSSFGYTPRTVAAIPDPTIVDWILVEVRTGTASATKVAVQAGFLKSDGSIVDVDGTSPLLMPASAGEYYVVVRHRNHLAVMSAAPLHLDDASALYDFTTDQARAYGTHPMAALGSGVFALAAGNNDGNILVSTNDYNAIGFNIFKSGYYTSDHNLNGNVFVDDFNVTGQNLFMISQVP